MIQDLQVVVLHQLEPSTLSQVEHLLREDVLQALVDSVDLTLVPVEVVPPNLQSEDYYCQL